jgi:hypothetical protein
MNNLITKVNITYTKRFTNNNLQVIRTLKPLHLQCIMATKPTT